jgi:hypothetical protein
MDNSSFKNRFYKYIKEKHFLSGGDILTFGENGINLLIKQFKENTMKIDFTTIELLYKECQSKNGFDKAQFIGKLSEMDKIEFMECMEGLKKLIHHRDFTCGLYALDSNPNQLLHQLWQKTSDACPLEITEAENQELAFEEYVDEICFQIEF